MTEYVDISSIGLPKDATLHVGQPNFGDRATFLAKVNQILDNRWLTNNGPMVQELESRIAAHLGVRHCIAVCNGTLALEIAVRALGLTGEVIIPSWTFIATAHSLHWQGITPIFADIDPSTHNLDPEAVRRMITPRTSGIIGVHLWGRPAPIGALQAIADEHGLKLMFDAAHAFGCASEGKSIGHFGRCEVLSFHATKVFNTLEGGAIVTNDEDLAYTARLMRNFGFAGYDNVIHPGTNGKMPELNAAAGLVNLDALPDFIEGNRQRYEYYAKVFEGIDGLKLIAYNGVHSPNYHYVVIEVDSRSRDALIDALHTRHVLARRYFWPGCHGMKPYRDLYPHAHMVLPHTKEIADRVVVLPNGADVSQDMIAGIASIIRQFTKP